MNPNISPNYDSLISTSVHSRDYPSTTNAYHPPSTHLNQRSLHKNHHAFTTASSSLSASHFDCKNNPDTAQSSSPVTTVASLADRDDHSERGFSMNPQMSVQDSDSNQETIDASEFPSEPLGEVMSTSSCVHPASLVQDASESVGYEDAVAQVPIECGGEVEQLEYWNQPTLLVHHQTCYPLFDAFETSSSIPLADPILVRVLTGSLII